MRKIKFRIWDNLTNEMYYDALVGNCRGESTVPCVYLNDVGWAHTDNCVVEQFTGLYDNTQWQDLSEQERQKFYFENCSDDGLTIKYKTQEEVQHLWKGREIYEGDILSIFDDMLVGDEPFEIIWKEYSWFWKDNKNDDCFMKHIAEMSTIVGNIHDNKELLE